MTARTGPPPKARDEGMVTAFVVICILALFLLAGLVVDGGAVLAARARAVDQAQAAARAGAQHLDLSAYRTDGTVRLDPTAARAGADAYLAATGNPATIAIGDDEITVSVTIDQPLTVLGILGDPTVTVTGTGSASPAQGIQGPIP